MKAVVVPQFGGPEVLKLEEFPTPLPGPGQVLVRIHAAGVNPYETYMRAGTYAIKPPLPYTPGSDGAGIVEAVGQGADGVRPGDRVYISTSTGTYAEYAVIPKEHVHPLPAKVTFAQGASLWVPYGSAYHALYQVAEARAGESVLIHGASGGVGIAAVQMARAIGLKVLGTAGTDKGLDLVRREGAHQAFNHTKAGYLEEIQSATSKQGVDIVLEMLANVNLANDLKLLAQQGRVVIIGSRGDISISPRDLMVRRGTIRGFTLWGISESEQKEIHAGLLAGMENGALRPIVGKELPLAEAGRAHKEILEPGAFGKIVLVP